MIFKKNRVVKTGSKAEAVQVVRNENGKRIVLKHIGSAHNEEELDSLLLTARQWIKDYNGQTTLFANQDTNEILHKAKYFFKKTYFSILYLFISKLICGFKVNS